MVSHPKDLLPFCHPDRFTSLLLDSHSFDHFIILLLPVLA
jgi:hypothetical protein